MPERWTSLLVGPVPQAVRGALEALGAAICSAGDAPEADRVLGEREIDLVVSALDDPNLVALVRRDAGARHLPVLALVPPSAAAARLALLEAGADDVRDPAGSVEELSARVRHHLALRERVDGLLADVRRLRELSSLDGLTQLHNHRAFTERLADEFRRAQRYDDALALVMLDVDHFKQINDTFGHPTGDEVLRRVADCLKAAVRETDFIARYGGEEFALLLPRTNLAGALTVSERVHQDLRRLRLGPDQRVQVTASFGVSVYPGRHVGSPDALVKTADEALYRSKREGRNRISLYRAPAPPPAPRAGGSA